MAVQPGPLFDRVFRASRAGDQVQTRRLVRALVAHVTTRADVTRLDQPDSCQGDFGLLSQSIDDQLQHFVDGSLLCHVQQEPLYQIDVGRTVCRGHAMRITEVS